MHRIPCIMETIILLVKIFRSNYMKLWTGNNHVSNSGILWSDLTLNNNEYLYSLNSYIIDMLLYKASRIFYSKSTIFDQRVSYIIKDFIFDMRMWKSNLIYRCPFMAPVQSSCLICKLFTFLILLHLENVQYVLKDYDL